MTVHPTAREASAGPAAPPAGFAHLPRRQVVGTLVALALSLLLSALDQTIVGTAMPRIVAELQGFDQYAWVTTAYLLSSTTVVPIVGKLSDLYGRKPFFLIGIIVFLIASALCGAAQDMLQLVLFRGLQGLGAGFIMSMVFIVIGDLFPPAQRGRIQGIFSSIFGLASIVGPLLGGYITDHLTWRWVFFVNLPVGLFALVAVLLLFPHIRPPRRQHSIDYAGALTLMLASVALLLALSWGGQEYPWTSPPIIGLLSVSVLGVGLFIRIERRAAEPIIPLELFRNSIVSVSVLTLTLMAVGMFGALLFIPLFIQGVIGATATESGTALMPMMLGMVFSSIAAGQLISRTGRYRPAALTGLGLTLVSIFLLSRLSTTASYGEVVFDMILMGLGLGTCMPVFTLVVQNAVPYAQLGVATSMSQFARSIGGTLGAAAFGSLLVNRYEPAFRAALTDELLTTLPAEQLARFDNPQSLLNPLEAGQLRETFAQYGPQGPMLLEQLREAIRVGLASAIQEMFLVGTFVVLLAFVTALFLKEIPLRRSHAGAAPDSERPSASNGAAGGPPTVTASESRVQPVRGGGRPAVERPSAEASGRH